MKASHLFFVALPFVAIFSTASAQSVGIGTSNPAPNAMLHIVNADNRTNLLLETTGSNSGLQINSAGTAPGINIQKQPGSTGQAIYIDHQGNNGPVLQVMRTNAAANGASIIGYSNSNQNISPAIYANHEGVGDASFVSRINNAANPFSAVFAETNGTGSCIFSLQLGTGRAGQFQISNPASSAAALRGFTNGTGMSGFFTVANAASTSAGVFSATNGTGPAIQAESSSLTDALALFVSNGGVRLAVHTLSTSGAVAARSAVYRIDGGDTYTLGFTPVEGDVFFIYNNTGSAVNFAGVALPANSGASAVFVAGTLRTM